MSQKEKKKGERQRLRVLPIKFFLIKKKKSQVVSWGLDFATEFLEFPSVCDSRPKGTEHRCCTLPPWQHVNSVLLRR